MHRPQVLLTHGHTHTQLTTYFLNTLSYTHAKTHSPYKKLQTYTLTHCTYFLLPHIFYTFSFPCAMCGDRVRRTTDLPDRLLIAMT